MYNIAERLTGCTQWTRAPVGGRVAGAGVTSSKGCFLASAPALHLPLYLEALRGYRGRLGVLTSLISMALLYSGNFS